MRLNACVVRSVNTIFNIFRYFFKKTVDDTAVSSSFGILYDASPSRSIGLFIPKFLNKERERSPHRLCTTTNLLWNRLRPTDPEADFIG